MLLTRAGDINQQDEDQLAFFRDEREFRNVRLVERADADFAELAARLLIFSAWRLALFQELTASPDPVLAAIAAKGAKELAYHRDYAAGWVIRLGDGTEFSHAKAQAAVDGIWPLVTELNVPPAADAVLDAVFSAATLIRPSSAALGAVAGKTGRDGTHTEAMGYVLAELQSVARAYPGAKW